MATSFHCATIAGSILDLSIERDKQKQHPLNKPQTQK